MLFRSAAKVCVVGKTVVDNLFPDGSNPVGKVIRFQKLPFRIVGVLESKGYNSMGMDQDDLILAPYTTIQKKVLAITSRFSLYGIHTSVKCRNSLFCTCQKFIPKSCKCCISSIFFKKRNTKFIFKLRYCMAQTRLRYMQFLCRLCIMPYFGKLNKISYLKKCSFKKAAQLIIQSYRAALVIYYFINYVLFLLFFLI